MLTRQDQIWNRALMGSNDTLYEGDVALANLLLAHSAIMNGGVLDTLLILSESQRESVAAGFRYFGFPEIAEVFSQVPDDTEENEEKLDNEYWRFIPDDSPIINAFRVKLLSSPDAFAPVSNNENS